MSKELRPYQQAIVDEVIASDKDDIVCLPTGGGKTLIASAIMSLLPGKCLFIVPRLELIKQAKDEFGDTDVVWSDKTELSGKKIIVASKDSLRTQKQKLSFSDGEQVTLIFDECHIGIKQTHSLTETFRHICANLRVLGLTATPERMDGSALLKGGDTIHKYGVFDRVLQRETVASLIEKHWLTPLKYYAKPIEGITKIRPANAKGEELTGEQMMKIMNENNIWGDLVGCYEKYGAGRPAVGFTVTIEMAEDVCEVFRQSGYDFRVIHGGMGVKERQELIDMLASGKVHGLVNAALLTYGFDCPPVSYAFSVRHIKSRPLWFQMVGRILRLSDGKENAVFVDHGDSISEFAEPANPLPILAPVMDWRADGEDKVQRELRKKAAKKAQDTMRAIQDIAPMDVDMVEVTTENIYERLVALILELKEELKRTKKEKEAAEKGRINAEIEAKRAANQYNALQTVAQDIVKELKDTRAELEEAKKAAPKEKYVDKDKTYNYIRVNYGRIRDYYAKQGYSPEEQHRRVRQLMLADEEDLDFYFDKVNFESGLKYWWNKYDPDYWSKKNAEKLAQMPAEEELPFI